MFPYGNYPIGFLLLFEAMQTIIDTDICRAFNWFAATFYKESHHGEPYPDDYELQKGDEMSIIGKIVAEELKNNQAKSMSSQKI